MVSSQLPATNYQFHHLTAAVAVCRSEEIDAGDQLDCANLAGHVIMSVMTIYQGYMSLIK